MTIAKLALRKLSIPFKVAFSHASATRQETCSFWVYAHAANGLVGQGEGCPRDYVTGESLATGDKFFREVSASVIEQVRDLKTLQSWMAAYASSLDANPAAWCAIELALLDLFAQQHSLSLEALLSLPELKGTFGYSAVLGDAEVDAYRAQLARYQALAFRDYKIKLSGALDRDQSKMKALQEAGVPADRVRLDANNLWANPAQALGYLESLAYPCWAIEEPLQPGAFEGLQEISDTLGISIILDESFLRMEHFQALNERPDTWLINARVSKLGGLLRSLEIVEQAKRLGIRLIVGAQVGETSLLTRAALTVASAAGDSLVAQEGGFGTFLLSADVCDPSLMFGHAGQLNTQQHKFSDSSGYGLKMSSDINHFLHAI